MFEKYVPYNPANDGVWVIVGVIVGVDAGFIVGVIVCVTVGVRVNVGVGVKVIVGVGVGVTTTNDPVTYVQPTFKVSYEVFMYNEV